MCMKNVNRKTRVALAALFWLAVWQIVSAAVGQPILLASPTATLARLGALAEVFHGKVRERMERAEAQGDER